MRLPAGKAVPLQRPSGWPQASCGEQELSQGFTFSADRPTSEAPTVAIVCGGWTGERAFSLQSAADLAQTCERAGFASILLETYGDCVDRWARSALSGLPVDRTLVFPYVFGPGGEDGRIAEIAQCLGLRFYGPFPEAHKRAFDKAWSRRCFAAAGLKVPAQIVVAAGAGQTAPEHSAWPVIVKPAAGGSSQGVTLAACAGSLSAAISRAAIEHHDVLIEEYIPGLEITLACYRLGREFGCHAAHVSHDRIFFDETLKRSGNYRVLPALLPPAKLDLLKNQGQLAYEALGASDLVKLDVIVDPSGDFYFIECDSIPGHGPEGLSSKIFRACGADYDEVMRLLLDAAWNSGIRAPFAA